MSDTPKSDTPMTDDEAFMLDDGVGEAVMADFARQLERENARLRAACPYCTSDNDAIRATYYDQTCEGCVKRMVQP